MIVAHRGFAHDNQENTLDAFHDAEVNADFIELDVRNTSDNIPVVHHDECVTEDNYCINDMTYTELHDKGFDYIPKLEDVCSNVETPIIFEIKDSLSVDRVVDMYNERDCNLDVIQSFDPSIIRDIRDNYSGVRLSILCSTEDVVSVDGVHNNSITSISRAIDFCLDYDIHSINMHHEHVCEENLRNIDDNGIKKGVWTIRDKDMGRRMIEEDIDYLITDSYRYVDINI